MTDMIMVKHRNEESMIHNPTSNDHDIAIASENEQNETNHMTKPNQNNRKDSCKLNNFDGIIIDSITQMYDLYIGFLSFTFADNFGASYEQSLTNSDASTIPSDYSSLPCALSSYGGLSSDIWSDSDTFEFENIILT